MDGDNLTLISVDFSSDVFPFNPNRSRILNLDQFLSGVPMLITFSCDCLGPDPAHAFPHATQFGDRYDTIAGSTFANLTTQDDLARVNAYDPNRIPDAVPINITVTCSYGDPHVSINLDLRLSKGIDEVNDGRYAYAISIFDQILKEDSDYPEALIGRWTAYAFQGELEAAIADFTKALQADPSAGEAWKRRGHLSMMWVIKKTESLCEQISYQITRQGLELGHGIRLWELHKKKGDLGDYLQRKGSVSIKD